MPIKPTVRIIPGDGPWPDFQGENLAYWLTRPPGERVQAARDLLRELFERLRRPWPARIARTARPFAPGA